jgi:hypothetical protein
MRTNNDASPPPAIRYLERRALALLLSMCGLLIVVGIALTFVTAQASTAREPLTLGDVSGAQIVEIRDHRGIAVMSGEFRSRVDTLGSTEKDAALLDRRGESAIGEVELEIPSADRADRRTELEVDVLGLAPRETFSVVIDDRVVAVFNTDDRGSVDMEIEEGEVLPGPAGQ